MKSQRFSIWRAAPVLLTLSILFWAGNSIVGRALADAISPFTLSFWRWLLALILVTPFAWRGLKADAPELVRRWKMILALALTGVTTFGTLLYFGLHTTTAINSILLQAAIPPLVMLFGWLAFGQRASLGEIAGIGLSLLGVVAVITKGRPWDLMHLGLNSGDGLVTVAVVLYAVYSLLLKRRPKVAPLSLLWAISAASALLLAPFFLADLAGGRAQPITPTVLAGIAYVAVFPSFLAYLFYNRGIELIGASRATQFLHLQPLFGALMAVFLLGEKFHAFHAIGLLLIAAGIGVGAWSARRAARDDARPRAP
ncbi:MAG: EamA family transporter [Caulobacteraceae bacterium]|nr:EamA family transporter [Caulobacteraceae bacterium]